MGWGIQVQHPLFRYKIKLAETLYNKVHLQLEWRIQRSSLYGKYDFSPGKAFQLWGCCLMGYLNINLSEEFHGGQEI